VIFVDTGAWYATFVPSDRDHDSANAWFEGNNERLATTDYVIDEILPLLKVRDEYRRALHLGQKLDDARQ
jgi:predicted nucleic acid-binding protein